jgi:hypothetical protein
MIVVGIIGILARSRFPTSCATSCAPASTETLTHLKGIASTEDAYYAEHGTYVSVPIGVPAAMLGGTQRVPWPSGTAFDVIGWSPEAGSCSSTRFARTTRTARAHSPGSPPRTMADLDSDGVHSYSR